MGSRTEHSMPAMLGRKLVLHSKNMSGSPEKTEGSGAGSLVKIIVSCRACANDDASLLFVCSLVF